MKPDICIYHGNCVDGFGAAWAVWKRFGDGVEYVPGIYGKPPPEVTGKHVLMVDFSYKRPVLDEMARTARSITILDHHKTAEADLAPFKVELCGGAKFVEADIEGAFGDLAEIDRPAILAHFDMKRSGAVMAWQFCHPDEALPELLLYIQDRDLWKFELEDSRAVAAWLFSHPYDFELWDDLSDWLDESKTSVIDQGNAIERKHHKDIDELLDQTLRYMTIGGHHVPVANLPYTMASDAAGKLAEGNPFAACYFDRPDARVFSLRSRGTDGLDVAEIAKAYGGGGHKNAAGFQAPLGWEGDQPQGHLA